MATFSQAVDLTIWTLDGMSAHYNVVSADTKFGSVNTISLTHENGATTTVEATGATIVGFEPHDGGPADE